MLAVIGALPCGFHRYVWCFRVVLTCSDAFHSVCSHFPLVSAALHVCVHVQPICGFQGHPSHRRHVSRHQKVSLVVWGHLGAF